MSRNPKAGQGSAGTCGACLHFCNAPLVIEDLFRGLAAMSSGFGSVRAHDGLCQFHEIYLSVGNSCSHFTTAPLSTESR